MSFKSSILNLSNITLAPKEYTCTITGEKAHIKRFTVSESEYYTNAIMKAETGKINATAFSLIMCDEKGNLLFTKDDIDKICKLPDNVVDNALQTFNRLNKTTSIEQAEKN